MDEINLNMKICKKKCDNFTRKLWMRSIQTWRTKKNINFMSQANMAIYLIVSIIRSAGICIPKKKWKTTFKKKIAIIRFQANMPIFYLWPMIRSHAIIWSGPSIWPDMINRENRYISTNLTIEESEWNGILKTASGRFIFQIFI